MKQCPICQSIAFDDAAVCYGCLHGFASEDELVKPRALEAGHAAIAEAAPVAADAPSPAVVIDATPPSFIIQIRPERERSGLVAWSCTVDLVPA